MKGNVKEIYTVLDGKHKQLKIPVYQRNYDWGERQCERLFDDLVDVKRYARPKHFFGAVVGNAESSFDWVVIDGQQRLTTVSLLILALSNCLKDGTIASNDRYLGRKIREDYLETAESGTGEVKLKLKPVKHDEDAYKRLLLGETPIESSTVTANYRYFVDRIQQGELTGDELWDAICRLEVMILDLESHDDPQRIFESLNSTGKALTESDKIRNLVLMGEKSSEQVYLYEDFWNRIENNVGFDTDTFVRLYLIVRTRKIPRFDAVYDAFRKFHEESDESNRDILASMRAYSEFYRDLNHAQTGVMVADKRLRMLNLLRHDVAMPTLMQMLGAFRSGEIGDNDFADCVTIVDNYIYRRMIVGLQTNALNKIFATLYNDAKRMRTENSTLSEVIAYLLLRRADTSGRFPDDDEFRDAFETRNIYNLPKSPRRYTFQCLENANSKDGTDIAKKLEDGELTIEHVMPQKLTRQWRDDLGENVEEVHKTWLNRIGNLTVTGYNSEYSNSTFEAKKTVVGGFNESPFKLNNSIKQAEAWNEEAIRRRNTQLTDRAMGYWTMVGSDFQPKSEPLPTVPMGVDNVFTNRSVVAYEFEGTSTTVSSWKDLMKALIRQLLAERREAIFDYAQTGGLGFTAGSQRSNSHQEEIVPGLWTLINCSTNDKLVTLRHLFEFLELDPNELIFTLRNAISPSDSEPDVKPNKYEDLTKYMPQIEELSGTDATEEDIEEIIAEFKKDCAQFEPEDYQSVVGKRKLPDFSKTEDVEKLTADEVFGAMKLLDNVEILMGGAYLDAVKNGTLLNWLKRLETLGAA